MPKFILTMSEEGITGKVAEAKITLDIIDFRKRKSDGNFTQDRIVQRMLRDIAALIKDKYGIPILREDGPQFIDEGG